MFLNLQTVNLLWTEKVEKYTVYPKCDDENVTYAY